MNKKQILSIAVGLLVAGGATLFYSQSEAERKLNGEISILLAPPKQGLIASGTILTGGISIAAKLLGMENQQSSDPYFVDKLQRQIKQRIAAGEIRNGSRLSPRQEALAVLEMPATTSDQTLKLRLQLIDRVLNESLALDPRMHADGNIAFFQWINHAS